MANQVKSAPLAAGEETGADSYPGSQSSSRHCGNPSWPIPRCGWIPLWPAWAPPLRDRSGRDKGDEKTHSEKMRGGFSFFHFSWFSQSRECLLSVDWRRKVESNIEAGKERLKSNSQMHSGKRVNAKRVNKGEANLEYKQEKKQQDRNYDLKRNITYM